MLGRTRNTSLLLVSVSCCKVLLYLPSLHNYYGQARNAKQRYEQQRSGTYARWKSIASHLVLSCLHSHCRMLHSTCTVRVHIFRFPCLPVRSSHFAARWSSSVRCSYTAGLLCLAVERGTVPLFFRQQYPLGSGGFFWSWVLSGWVFRRFRGGVYVPSRSTYCACYSHSLCQSVNSGSHCSLSFVRPVARSLARSLSAIFLSGSCPPSPISQSYFFCTTSSCLRCCPSHEKHTLYPIRTIRRRRRPFLLPPVRGAQRGEASKAGLIPIVRQISPRLFPRVCFFAFASTPVFFIKIAERTGSRPPRPLLILAASSWVLTRSKED